ncbi:MAG: nuclear transport factor 2 family protein [Gammaproteobacteria bacterium]|nr:nuclear transport factor 2 family protein [Gammaproteobacteria bacterium]MBL4729760.1 nuclear transport factor 2 family protein [Gammaproteobacteria bacterium]
MNQKSTFTYIALLVAFAIPVASAQQDDASQIRELLEQVAADMQAGNLDALNGIYAEGRGVHIIEGAGVNHGWVDYRDHHLKPELDAFENFTYRFFAIEPQVKGNFAYVALRYELNADIEDRHIAIEGRGTYVLEKIDANWRIVHTHTSGRAKQ